LAEFDVGTRPVDGADGAARDLQPGDTFKRGRWSVVAVERPLNDGATIRVTLVKPKSGRTLKRGVGS
jgi:hypothetical protein